MTEYPTDMDWNRVVTEILYGDGLELWSVGDILDAIDHDIGYRGLMEPGHDGALIQIERVLEALMKLGLVGACRMTEKMRKRAIEDGPPSMPPAKVGAMMYAVCRYGE